MHLCTFSGLLHYLQIKLKYFTSISHTHNNMQSTLCISNTKYSTTGGTNASSAKVFHDPNIRQLIFQIKANNDPICSIRLTLYHRLQCSKNSQHIPTPHSIERQIHSTHLRNWRETAVLLGLYWMIDQAPSP